MARIEKQLPALRLVRMLKEKKEETDVIEPNCVRGNWGAEVHDRKSYFSPFELDQVVSISSGIRSRSLIYKYVVLRSFVHRYCNLIYGNIRGRFRVPCRRPLLVVLF